MDILITTSQKPSEEMIDKALKVGEFLNAQYVSRKSLGNLEANKTYLVVTKNGLVCHRREHKFFFHPSMAMLRIKRIDKGEEDIFTSLCGKIGGYDILDCTMGFAADTLVFSKLVGEQGSVTSLEKSKLIYTIVSDGLISEYDKWQEINCYASRVTSINQDYATFLRSCEDKSYNVVFFDPMFEKPLSDSIHLEPLRYFADESPLTKDVIEQAKRVAKNIVIVKNNRSFDFNKLGITNTYTKASSKTNYGYIKL